MLSPRSSRPAPPTLLEMLPDTVVDVAEQAFFAWAERCDGLDLSELARGSDAALRWLGARVEFTGAIAGSLEVLLTAELADELGVVMMGETAGHDLAEAQLKDVAGEMANILCGALLRRAGHEFRLKPPETCVAAAPASADGYMPFFVNERPLLVRSSLR